MGWKASNIYISPCGKVEDCELLYTLGFKEFEKQDKVSYEIAMNPSDDMVYIGRYKDLLIICVNDLPLNFFTEDDELSQLERSLVNQFPNSDIFAFQLYSTTNNYGYAVLEKGKKVRVKAGFSDEPVLMEYGPPLEEEKELYSSIKKDENGIDLFYFDDDPDDGYTEDAIGESLVFNISSRFIGKNIDMADDDFHFDSIFNSYQITSSQATESSKKSNYKKVILPVVLAVIVYIILRNVL